MTYPRWARTPEAQALLAQIISNPECFVSTGDTYNTGGRTTYTGKAASSLRRIYNAWWEANYDKPRDERQIEDANELIGRVLREEYALTRCEGDPLLKRRAA
jgi:hypothetical protein